MTMKTITELARECHELAKFNGFWDLDAQTPGEFVLGAKLALIHSEVSELLEESRKGKTWDKDALMEECADIIIRTMDFAEWLQPGALEQAIIDKHERNKLRPYKHGKTW